MNAGVFLAIMNEVLRDLVEISLRIDGIPICEKALTTSSVILADTEGLANLKLEEVSWPQRPKILLLVTDEAEIQEGFEYLVIPASGDHFELDPELLVRKVQEMLTGRKSSAERNPLTGLPGAAAFEAELRDRINTGERFGVIFADLNAFKNYNKAYSYTRGDELLTAIARLLEEELEKHPHPQNFLAHLGSDDFAIITSEKLAPKIGEEIVDAFDELAASFYDVGDLARGYVLVADSRGRETKKPLVTIALAVVLSSKHPISHAAEIFDIADDLFKVLKSREIPESCCIVERGNI